MMLQNRVDPWVPLNAALGRNATRMGNRGRLHDELKTVVRDYLGKRWITCLLTVNGKEPRKGKVWGNSYSELFFLDEATAYSAGHRPCAYCDRSYDAFYAAWRVANPDALLAGSSSVKDIDASASGAFESGSHQAQPHGASGVAAGGYVRRGQ